MSSKRNLNTSEESVVKKSTEVIKEKCREISEVHNIEKEQIIKLGSGLGNKSNEQSDTEDYFEVNIEIKIEPDEENDEEQNIEEEQSSIEDIESSFGNELVHPTHFQSDKKETQVKITDYLEVRIEENEEKGEVQNIEKEQSINTESSLGNESDEQSNIEETQVKITDYLEVKIEVKEENEEKDELENIEKEQSFNTESSLGNKSDESQVKITDYLEVKILENGEKNEVQTVEKEQIMTTDSGKKKRKRYATEKQINKKAKYIDEHGVQKGCTDNCKKKCMTKFNEEDRKVINKYYWSLSWEEQHVFLKHSACLATPKHKKTKDPKRHPRRTFFFKLGGERTEVCRCFYLTTLGYKSTNDKALYNALSSDESTPIDRRGKHRYVAFVNKERIAQHIQSFIPNSGNQEPATQPKYLPSDLTVTAMYEDFLKKYPAVKISYDVYRKEMKSLNICVTQPGQKSVKEVSPQETYIHCGPQDQDEATSIITIQ